MVLRGRRTLARPRRALVALVILILPVTATGASPSAHLAEFEYGLGSVTTGKVSGQCASAAVLFPVGAAGSFDFVGAGGTLEHYVTRWNTTVLLPQSGNPVIMPESPRQVRDGIDSLDAGRTAVDWDSGTRVRVFGPGWPATAPAGLAQTFTTRFEGDGLRTQPPNLGFDDGEYFVASGGETASMKGGVAGWNRELEVYRGSIDVTGDVTLFLEGGRIVDASGQVREFPPAHQATVVADTVAMKRVQHEFRHALLRIDHARIALDGAQAVFGCKDLEASIQGTMVAHGARGSVEAGDQRLDFGPADLSVGGRFDLSEGFVEGPEGEAAKVTGRAEGEFNVVGLDFAAAPIGLSAEAVVAAVGSVGLAALASVAAWRLYTRLQKPGLLNLETRGLVYEALRSNPWSTLPEIQRTAGMRRSTVRYQLGVLKRHGLVRLERTGSVTRFAAQGDDVAPPSRVDPVLETLKAQVRPGPVRLAAIMRALMDEHEYSRYGAWKAVRRATRDGLVQVDRGEKEVWVRCTT